MRCHLLHTALEVANLQYEQIETRIRPRAVQVLRQLSNRMLYSTTKITRELIYGLLSGDVRPDDMVSGG